MSSLSTSSSSNISDVKCPITFKSLSEIDKPVFLTVDGYIYELEAIQQWLDEHGNSPVNRKSANVDDLVTVYATLSKQTSTSLVTPVNQIIIIAFDVSSSMLAPVTVKVQDDTGNQTEQNDGLSRADVAKHSAKSIITAAKDDTVIGIVAFGTGSWDVLQPTIMNAKGKTEALKIITKLRINGSTYLNDGIRRSLTMSDQAGCYYPDAKKHIWVFSDGEPNEPTDNHVGNLKTYQTNRMVSIKAYQLLKTGKTPKEIEEATASYRASLADAKDFPEWKISTFAYGTECDSNLLWEIANQGNGSFGFIPDASWVETVFTHYFTNVMIPTPVVLSASEENKRLAFIKVLEQVVSIVPHGFVQESPFVQAYRREINDSHLQEALQVYTNYTTNTDGTPKDVGLWSGKDDKGFDQITISLSKDPSGTPYWLSWGRPYVKSLVDALKLKECTNKRDPCLQQFTRGKTWEETRDKICNIFCEMPPPVPERGRKRRRHSYRGFTSSRNTSNSSPPPPNSDMMRNYSQAVCFHEDTMVTLEDGKVLTCKELVPGTRLATCKIVTIDGVEYLERSVDTIEYIVKTSVCTPKLCKLVPYHSLQVRGVEEDKTNALFVTPWHPVAPEVCIKNMGDKTLHKDSTWEFPCKIANIISPEHPKCNGDIESGNQFVYSFVMKNRHIGILCDGFWSITLAHDSNMPNAKHDFWGTEKVINDLKDISSEGVATITSSNITRDVNNNVISIR